MVTKANAKNEAHFPTMMFLTSVVYTHTLAYFSHYASYW